MTTALANSCVGSLGNNDTTLKNNDINSNKIINNNSTMVHTLSADKSTNESNDKVRSHGNYSTDNSSSSGNASNTTMTIPLPRSKQAEERQQKTTSGSIAEGNKGTSIL